MSDDRQDKPLHTMPRRLPAKAAGALAVFYAAALLLNADGLLRNAQHLPHGVCRAHGIALVEPVASVAHRLGLTRLRSGIERWINGGKKGTPE